MFFFFSFILPAVELELASVCCGFYFVCVPSSVCTLLLRVLKTRRLDPTLGAGFVGSGMSKHSGPRVVWHGIYFRRLPRVCVSVLFSSSLNNWFRRIYARIYSAAVRYLTY